MAEKQGKIRITASAELGELQKLNSTIDKMEASFLKAVSAASLLNKGWGALASTIKEGYADLDSYSKATVVFTGNLEMMRKATKGTVADLDLMQAANRMTTLGVKLTDQEMATLLGDVKKLAGAMGIDMKSALESTATALARQSDKIADNVGIVLKAETAQEKYAASLGRTVASLTDAEKKLAFQKEFVEQAHAKALQLAEGNATLTDSFNKLSVSIKNTTMEMLNFINKVGGPNKGTRGAVAGMPGGVGYGVLAADTLGDLLHRAAGGGGYKTWRSAYLAEEMAAGGLGAMEDEGFGPGGMGGAEEWGSSRSGTQDPFAGTPFAALMKGPRGHKRERRAGKKDPRWRYNPKAEQARLEKWINETLSEGERREGVQRGLAEGARERGIDYESQKALEATLEANKKEMEAMDRRHEALTLAVEDTKRFNESLRDLATTGLKSVYGGLLDLADAAIQGQEGIGKMALNMLKAVSLGLSQQLFAMGLAATFEAKGYLAGVVSAPMAIPAAAKAAIFFAGATALAGLGLGLSAATAGMGGGASAGAGRGSSAGADYRPNFGAKQSSKDLPPVVIRMTFDRSDPAAESFMRRKVRAEILAAGYSETP